MIQQSPVTMAARTVLTNMAIRSPCRLTELSALRQHFTTGITLASQTSTLPRIASPSIWHSLVPKAFRRPDDLISVAEREKAQKERANKPKEWNPATFFIAMAVLIGSNAIQGIALRNERLKFTRRTDAKLELLRETIDRVRKGEDVDVEKLLGAGDPAKENEWEEGVYHVFVVTNLDLY